MLVACSCEGCYTLWTLNGVIYPQVRAQCLKDMLHLLRDQGAGIISLWDVASDGHVAASAWLDATGGFHTRHVSMAAGFHMGHIAASDMGFHTRCVVAIGQQLVDTVHQVPGESWPALCRPVLPSELNLTTAARADHPDWSFTMAGKPGPLHPVLTQDLGECPRSSESRAWVKRSALEGSDPRSRSWEETVPGRLAPLSPVLGVGEPCPPLQESSWMSGGL